MSVETLVTDVFKTNMNSVSGMEFIDMLYNQDVDMGVSRDLYDPLYHEKQQKQLETQKQERDEMVMNKLKEEAAMYRIDGETGERVLITDSKPTNYLSQLSKQSLSHDLEELSQMIGFENGGLDSYLDMSGPFSMATEQNAGAESLPWSGQPYCEPAMPATTDDAVPPSSHNNCDNQANGVMEFENNYGDIVCTDMDIDLMMLPSSYQPSQHYTQLTERYNQDDSVTDFEPFIFTSAPPSSSQSNSGSQSSSSTSSDKFLEHASESSQSMCPSPQFDHSPSAAARSASRDRTRCEQLGIPYSVQMITNCLVDEFNSMLKNSKLTEEQMTLMRDIRRRGKNKVAAQNCRKKKVHELTGLEEEIRDLRRRRAALLRDKAAIQQNKQELECQVNHTYAEVFSSLTDPHGHNYDPRFYRLHITDSGQPHIVPNRAYPVPFPPTEVAFPASHPLLDLSMKA